MASILCDDARRRRIGPIALVVSLGFVLQLLASNIFFIGFFIDDAYYILTARCLPLMALGRAIPYDISLATRFPAFPLLLCPLVWLAGPTSFGLRLFSLAATVLAGVLFGLLEKKRVGPSWALCGLGLFLFNATVVRYAGTVMSEPAFIAACLGCVYLVCECPEREAFAVAALALASLLRPQGVIFLGAVVAAGLDRKSRTRTLKTAAAAAAIYAAVLGAIFFRTGRLTSYFADIARGHPGGFLLPSYLAGLKVYLGMTFPATFFECPPVRDALLRKAVAWSAIGGGSFLMIRGAAGHWRDRFVRISAAYVVMSLAALPFWIAVDQRYVLVLVPFLAMLFVRGLASLRRPAPRPTAGAVIALLAVFHLRADAINLMESFEPAVERRVPRRALDFLNQKAAPGSRVMAFQVETIQLYTPLPVLRPDRVGTKEEFIAELERKGISLVVVRERRADGAAAGSDAGDFQLRVAAWLESSPSFQAVFSDPAEDIEIYARK